MKYFIAVILTFTILLVGCSQNDSTAPNTNNPQITPTVSDVSETIVQTVSQAELSSHSKENDCWIAYQGAVYDVTSYVPIHPGGAAQIVPLCGTSDKFEDAFTVQHGTSKVKILEKQGVYKGKLV